MSESPLELQERHKFSFSGESNLDSVPNLDSVWAEFTEKFPTTQSCTQALIKGSYGDEAIECRFCKCDDVEWLSGGRVIRCNNCGKKMWLMANTFFERSKHHRAWLGGIWLKEHGMCLSASKFQRLVGDISYSSALAIHKKLAVVIHSRMHEDFASAPAANFRKAICRRSRQTSAGHSPSPETEVLTKTGEALQKPDELDTTPLSTNVQCPDERGLSRNLDNDFTNSLAEEETTDAEKKILDILSTEPLNIDNLLQRAKLSIDQCLATLTMLELKGLAVNVGKNRFTGVLQKKLNAVSTYAIDVGLDSQSLISAALEFIKSKFHGVSTKYLQYYLAEYWCHVDRNRWLPGSLLRACHEFRRVTYNDLLAYESPSELRILPSGRNTQLLQ